jgi:hypothetical protein
VIAQAATLGRGSYKVAVLDILAQGVEVRESSADGIVVGRVVVVEAVIVSVVATGCRRTDLVVLVRRGASCLDNIIELVFVDLTDESVAVEVIVLD